MQIPRAHTQNRYSKWHRDSIPLYRDEETEHDYLIFKFLPDSKSQAKWWETWPESGLNQKDDE